MRASLRWLRELVPGLEGSAGEIAERLTQAGLEVEAVTEFGAGLDQVVVAAVTKVEPHPSRERLRLVTVDPGKGPEQRVVCGAANVPSPGEGLVVLAPLGTRLPAAGLTIEPRAIGGVESAGMLCSETELGLAESSDGILILPPGSAAPGTALARAIPEASDTLFHVGVTPNRPDALGHVGIARDLAALYGLTLRQPESAVVESAPGAIRDLLDVQIEEPERCPLYGARLVQDVVLAPSPSWLRFRLHALGVRPISNVVDVTNLLLLEFGQPMHAFDYDLVAGRRIVVRRAHAGEPFTTLDGVERKLDADDLVICDGEGPTALAGVMGGQRSEIRSTTRRVLLECAYFAPRGVRRTSRRHGLSTESSFRFERGVDPEAVPRVLHRAAALLAELAHGKVVPGALFAKGATVSVPKMRLRSSRLDALLGVRVPFGEATTALSRLGFGVEKIDDGPGGPVAEVRGVSFRPDVSREVDLVEEVARVRGLQAIPTVLPAIAPSAPRETGKLERRFLETAANLGLSEAVTYSFVAASDLRKVGAPEPVVVLRNPMTEERSVLRTSLLPGLAEVLRRAERRGEHEARLFTIGSVFLPPGDGSSSPARPRQPDDGGVLPEERPTFAALLAGPRPSYLSKPEDADVYDAKGLALELVFRTTGHEARTLAMSAEERLPHLHPRGAAWVLAGDVRVGSLGPLHPEVTEAFDLATTAIVVELDLSQIERLGRALPRYRPIPRLPAVARDVAVIVGERVAAADIEREIRAAAGELCESVRLFDVFRGGALGAGRLSLAYHVVYRDPKATTDPERARTLTDEEVDRRHERVRAAVKRLGELRE